jgi:hypothetical protein
MAKGGKGKTATGRAKRTDIELAEMHQKRYLALKLRSQKADVNWVMAEHPEAIRDIREHCVTLGYLEALVKAEQKEDVVGDTGAGIGDLAGFATPSPRGKGSHMPQDFKAENTEADQSIPFGIVDCKATGDKVVGEPDACEYVPDTYIRFAGDHGLSARWYRYLFKEMEPAALGPFSIKAIIPDGKREIDLKVAIEIMEYMTDLDGDTQIRGELRKREKLLAELKRRNELNGRPALDLIMPPGDWMEGWYATSEATETSVKLTMRKSETHLILKPSDLGMLKGADFKNIRIDKNFSKLRAELIDSTTLKRMTCHSLLAAVKGTDDTTPKPTERKRTQLADTAAGLVKLQKIEHETSSRPPPPPPKTDKIQTALAFVGSTASASGGASAPTIVET